MRMPWLTCSAVVLVVAGLAGRAGATDLPAVGSGTLVVHLDADQGVTVDANNVVTGFMGWLDQSGNGNHFGFAEGAPTLVPGAYNGQSVIRFNGADGRDRLANFVGGQMTTALGGQELTIFAVVQNATSGDGLFTSHPGFANTMRTAFGVVQIPGLPGAQVGVDPAGSVVTIRFANEDDPEIPGQFDAAHFQTYLRSGSGFGEYDSVYAGGPSGSVWQATTIGDADNNPFTGDLAEFVVYAGALSDIEREDVEYRLASSYAVPAGCGCGDLDGDDMVDLADFTLLAVCFGLTGPQQDCPGSTFACADLDGSGTVDLNDFSLFSSAFGLPAQGSTPNCD